MTARRQPHRPPTTPGLSSNGWIVFCCLAAMIGGFLSGPAPSALAEEATEDEDEEPVDLSGGRAPLRNDKMVPLAWMPPGTSASPNPSEEIFPPQTITIRFNHALHVTEFEQTCRACHSGAFGSLQASDRLLPEPSATCDNCHDVDHSDLQAVQSGGDANGKCDFCHIGDTPGKAGRVARMVVPDPNIRFPHKKHLDRNIACAQCHGQIEKIELATRDQLPRMAGCFTCHAMSGSAQGDAKGDCMICHLSEPNGVMKTTFSTGQLTPPQWLHGSAHTPDWIERHKGVAAANSKMCGSCHAEDFCSDCHDGKVRPRDVHPNDFISMHAQAARQDSPRCVNCHQTQSFCGDCHRRVGVARDAPTANRLSGRRFHPPPSVWTLAPRGPQHHAFEAQRNLNACVACHSERDCATCHATKGLRGGGGISPHPPGFETRCSLPMSRNSRPCLVCHTSSDPLLTSCR